MNQTRRSFLLGCGAAANGWGGGSVLQRPDESLGRPAQFTPRISIRHLHTIDGAYLRDVSSDSRRICATALTPGNGFVRFDSDGTIHSKGLRPAESGELFVFDLEPFAMVCRAPVQGDPIGAGFFPGSDEIMCCSVRYRTPAGNQTYLFSGRVGNGKLEGIVERTLPLIDAAYEPAEKDRLFADPKSGGIDQVRWPELSVAVCTGPVQTRRHYLAKARGARLVLRLEGRQLVCRRWSDLQVVWRRDLDPEIDMTATLAGATLAGARYAISSDGSVAAMKVHQVGFDGRPNVDYLEILDGRTGKAMGRPAIPMFDELAFSADGKLLAVSHLTADPDGKTEASADVYSMADMKQVGSATHTLLPKGRRLISFMWGIVFTADGRRLVTCANASVKIWAIEDRT